MIQNCYFVPVKHSSYPSKWRAWWVLAKALFIDPVQGHLGSMTTWSLCIVCTKSMYAYVTCLHRFGQFNAFWNMYYCIKSSLFEPFSDLKGMINSLLGFASIWYGSLFCAQCHTGTQPATSTRYDTLRMIFSCIIPPLHLVTNNTSTGKKCTSGLTNTE